ncbi:MAG: BON domain-containing protein [Bdellovibrionales bacterium]
MRNQYEDRDRGRGRYNTDRSDRYGRGMSGDYDYGTREFASQMYGRGNEDRSGGRDWDRDQGQDRDQNRDSGREQNRNRDHHYRNDFGSNEVYDRAVERDDGRTGYGSQDYNRDAYGSYANYGEVTGYGRQGGYGYEGGRGAEGAYGSSRLSGSRSDFASQGGYGSGGYGSYGAYGRDNAFDRDYQSGSRGSVWGSGWNDAREGKSYYGQERGTQGSGSQGSQGYGRYGGDWDSSYSSSSDDWRSGDRDRGFGRGYAMNYGTGFGSGYGTYDIGAQGASGFQRGSSGFYDRDRWERSNEGRRFGRHEESTWDKVKNFFGVGPKNYKRSDDRIREDVSDALERHPQIDASDIEVKVEEGVVTLSGTVDSRYTKRMAEDAVEDIYGVKDVVNHMRVRSSSAMLSTSGKEEKTTSTTTATSENVGKGGSRTLQ